MLKGYRKILAIETEIWFVIFTLFPGTKKKKKNNIHETYINFSVPSLNSNHDTGDG